MTHLIELPLQFWSQGIEEFNRSRYWHAHEEWEKGWKNLPEPHRTYLQALIQACGAFYLICEKPRISAAFSLARSSLRKLKQSSPLLPPESPRVEIPNLDLFLQNFIQTNPNSPDLVCLEAWKLKISQLKAELRLTRPVKRRYT
jgi:predicted metal-dependent hydrolase